jgi:hypothetical protein
MSTWEFKGMLPRITEILGLYEKMGSPGVQQLVRKPKESNALVFICNQLCERDWSRSKRGNQYNRKSQEKRWKLEYYLKGD